MSGGNFSFITCEVGLPRFSGSQAERTRRIPDQIPINRPSWPTCALQSMFLLNYDKSAAFFVMCFFCVHLKQCLFPAITLFTVFSLFTKHPTRCVVNSVALMNKSHVRPQWNCYSYLIVQDDTEGLVQGMPCLVFFFLLETRSQMMGQFKWLRALNHYLGSASVVILRQATCCLYF